MGPSPLFTDIEGSTRLLKQLREHYGDVLAEHERLLREVFAAHGGLPGPPGRETDALLAPVYDGLREAARDLGARTTKVVSDKTHTDPPTPAEINGLPAQLRGDHFDLVIVPNATSRSSSCPRSTSCDRRASRCSTTLAAGSSTSATSPTRPASRSPTATPGTSPAT